MIDTEPAPAGRRTTLLFAGALIFAAYTGFRMPGTWTTTLNSVSITGGFHRRFLVGSALHPVVMLTGYNYWVFAAASFAFLALLLVVLTVLFLRVGQQGRRLLIIAWFLLPTGGFLFHEVGYFEQPLYLMLFAALWLLHRDRVVAATCLMAIAVLVHEIALLTVLPIFGVVVLSRFPLRRAVGMLAAPVVLELVVLAVPASAPGATGRLATALAGANFPYRADALALFERTQGQSWQLYSVTDVLKFLLPTVILVIGGFLLLQGWNAAVLPVAAIAAPALLAFAGWDGQRWVFLLMANFAVVLWLWLGSGRVELSPARTVVLVVTLLALARIPLPYFDYCTPRAPTWPEVAEFGRQLGDQSLFRIPSA